MNNKLFTAIGTAAVVWAIYKVGEIKGSIATGLRFAKDPERGTKVKQVLDETEKAFKALDEGKKVNVRVTKNDFIAEVSDPEEGEEATVKVDVSDDETDDQPED